MNIAAAAVATVRVTTTHLVSASSWVNRARLVDEAAGVLVVDESGRRWLASTSDVLAPAADRLKSRSVENGGPPPEAAKVTLWKVTMAMPRCCLDDGDAGGPTTLTNPIVVVHPDGARVAAIALGEVGDRLAASGLAFAPLSAACASGTSGSPAVATGDRLWVHCPQNAADGTPWLLARPAVLASPATGGFAGLAAAVALDVRLDPSEAGAGVFSDGPELPCLVGVAQPLTAGLTVLLPTSLIAETVATPPAGGSETMSPR